MIIVCFMAFFMIGKRKNQTYSCRETDRVNPLRTVVSEVSSFVDNPVYIATPWPLKPENP